MHLASVDKSQLADQFEIWTEDQLRKKLVALGVWSASLNGNVECWYPKVLQHVRKGDFSFDLFADSFASNERFDFGQTLSTLLQSPPQPEGGWIDGQMC